MNERGRELVTSDEPTIPVKPLLDAMVMKNGQNDRCLADSTGTNESDGREVSLGAKGNLPSGYIVSFLWVLKQFTWLIPSR